MAKLVWLGIIILMLSACDVADQHHGEMHMPSAGGGAGPGVEMTRQFCSACHATPNAQAHSAMEWPAVVARMLGKIRRSSQPSPNPQQVGIIIDYLQAHGRPE